jgi:hypothetical protein
MTEKAEFKIENGVPLPPETRGRPVVYDWGKMKVGNSVLIKTDSEAKIASARTAASAYGRRHKMRFTSRRVSKGIRIWRKS